MSRFCLFVAFFFSVTASASSSIKFDLDSVPVSQVVRLVYGEAIKTPYFLDPSIVADARNVSFRWDASRGNVAEVLRAFLDALGYQVEAKSGVAFVTKKPETKQGEGVGQGGEKFDAVTAEEVFLYRPEYRDGGYIAEMVGPLFRGQFTLKRGISGGGGASVGASPSGSAGALIDKTPDVLIFAGSSAEVVKLKKLLPQIDTASPEVLVKGVLYEVQTSKNDGSAFKLAASLLGGKLSLGVGVVPGSVNALRYSASSFDLVLEAFATDSRFRVMSSPSMRVRSGSSARLTVGQDVPVLGAVSYPQGGGPAVQSVEYRSSGVIFDLSPLVRASSIDVKLNQQVSNFVTTTTGVNNSPTLIKRELATALSLGDGEVVVIGGLTEEKESDAATGLSFLPRLLRANTSDNYRSEVLLVLQVQKI